MHRSRKERKESCGSKEGRKKRREAGVQQSISGCTSRLWRLIFLKASSWVSNRSAGGRFDRPAPAHGGQQDVPSVDKVAATGSEGCSTVQGNVRGSEFPPGPPWPRQIYRRLLRRDKWRRGNTCCAPNGCNGSGRSRSCSADLQSPRCHFSPLFFGQNTVAHQRLFVLLEM